MKFTVFVLGLGLIASAAGAESRVLLPSYAVPSHYDLAITADPAGKTFSGTAGIDVAIREETRDITLNAADLVLGAVSLSGHSGRPAIRYDDEKQTVSLHFASPVIPGRYRLTIAYTGKINDGSAGLFVREYDTPAGRKRALYTKFEPAAARYFLPSWDEPAIKATFTVKAVLPAPETALSNMPVVAEKALPGGQKEVTFKTSPRMSTYLLFYGQGEFDRVTKIIDGVEIGVVAKRGEAARAKLALDAAGEILSYYNTYFGTPYPLPKLDLIAAVGQGDNYGAMENWGAIQFFENNLLFDEKLGGESEKRRVFSIVAHEMAHQWFGDLVTMDWWDDLWLNEGFASWMTVKAQDSLHPDWKPWFSALLARDAGMAMDGRFSTHPVIQAIQDVHQAEQAFDDITYRKGLSVIRMLEDYLGEEKFRDGVRAYMQKHAYANTVTDDLWADLEAASGQPVKSIAHDFTLKAGIPLIKAAKTAGGMQLTQDCFSAGCGSGEKPVWQVPVKVSGVDGKLLWQGIVADKPVDVAVPAGTFAVVNGGMPGYFRVQYDTALFPALSGRFSSLDGYDQYGVLSDVAALTAAGYEPVADHLTLLSAVTPNMDAKVQGLAATQISSVLSLVQDVSGMERARSFGIAVLSPLFAKIGWDGAPDEDRNIAVLRSQLLEVLGGRLAEPGVAAEAKKRFAAFLADRSSLSGALRKSVLDIIADHADAGDWEKLHALARSEPSVALKLEYYERLARPTDPALAKKALALGASPESWPTLATRLIAVAARSHPALAFDYALAHKDELDPQLSKIYRNRFYPGLLATSHDPEALKKLDDFAGRYLPPTGRDMAVRTKAGIAQTIKQRAETGPQVEAWLKQNSPAARR